MTDDPRDPLSDHLIPNPWPITTPVCRLVFASSPVIVSGLTSAWRTIAGARPGWTVRPLYTGRHQGRGAAWAPLISLQALLQLQKVACGITCSRKSFITFNFNCYRSCNVMGALRVWLWQKSKQINTAGFTYFLAVTVFNTKYCFF